MGTVVCVQPKVAVAEAAAALLSDRIKCDPGGTDQGERLQLDRLNALLGRWVGWAWSDLVWGRGVLAFMPVCLCRLQGIFYQTVLNAHLPGLSCVKIELGKLGKPSLF